MDHRTPSCDKFYWIRMKQALKERPEAALHNSVQLLVIIVSHLNEVLNFDSTSSLKPCSDVSPRVGMLLSSNHVGLSDNSSIVDNSVV